MLWPDTSSIWVQLSYYLRWCCVVVLPEVTWPEVTSVTWPEVMLVVVRKYVLRMCNRKLRYIRPSGAFWPEVTKSRDRKRNCPEVGSAHARLFPRVLYLAWWLELALVICLFYFHIVSRLCSTSKSTFENFHQQNVFFYIFTLLMFKIRQQLTKIKSINRFVITCGQFFLFIFGIVRIY